MLPVLKYTIEIEDYNEGADNLELIVNMLNTLNVSFTVYNEDELGKFVPTSHLIDVLEMAKFLNIGRNKAYTLIRLPEFPIVQIGCKCLIDFPKLKVWLEDAKNGELLKLSMREIVDRYPCLFPGRGVHKK